MNQSYTHHILLSVLLAISSGTIHAENVAAEYSDSIMVLNEVSVTAQKSGAVKSYSATSVNSAEISRYGINNLKEVSTIAPNFFIPEYG
ncbi:MAG: hypothetical protein K2M98_04105, partial [Muribaculum sp.]|nr:hypothetical protein [Muribaculum sp.]